MYRLIRELIDKWKLHRLLKQSGCKTIEEYNYNHDPNINKKATTVPEYYHGYPYYVRIPDSIFNKQDIGFDPIYVLNKWCNEHCKDKWRRDWHSVDTEYDIINDIGGTHHIYYAFTSQKDYSWFILSNEF